MSIPRGYIRKLANDDCVYTQGLSLFAEPFSHAISHTQFAGFYQVSASFSDAQVYLEIDNENELIENMTCSCGNCTNEKICVHVVALLIKIENEFFPKGLASLGKNTTPANTDEACQALMASRAKLLKARAQHRNSGQKALILPQLHVTKNHVYLGFKIGCQKAYVVKDLKELYQSLTHHTTGTCGKADNFLFVPENFENKAMIQFFMNHYPLCVTEKYDKFMRLSPVALDKFMELMADKKLNCDSRVLSIKSTPPGYTLSIRKSDNFYRLSLDRRDFSLYRGQEGIYILEGDVLYTCHADFADTCGELLKLFQGNDKTPIVSAQDMRTFYSMVLKPASRFIFFETKGQDFIPSALKTKIYLDIDDNHRVMSKTEFCYDDKMYPAFDPERDLQSIWDIERETKIENLLISYLPNLGKEPGTAFFDANDEKLFSLIHEGIPELSRYASLYVSKSLQAVKLHPFPKLGLGVRIESDLLKMDISAGQLPASVMSAALLAYRQKKQYIRLKNGNFMLLDSDNMIKFANVIQGMGISSTDLKKKDITLPLYRALYLNSITDIDVEKDPSFVKLADSFSELKTDETDIPKDLTPILRDYQKYGFKWLNTLSKCGFGGILADDMGLGKTIQVLSLLSAYQKKHGKCHALVVCPASLVLNWEQEVKRYTPNLSVSCILGTTQERTELLAKENRANIIITSYDLLKRDLELYQPLAFDFEIIDEAQFIKNHNTQNARAVKCIHATCRFALTGTPIENTISELWSIFDYLMPGYLYKYTRFRQRFEVPIVKEGDKESLEELKRMTAPFILRRLKKDVLKELPDKTEITLYTGLSQEQNTLYQANLASMRQELEEKLNKDDSGKAKMMALAMLTKLRQICCDPTLLYENYSEASAKLDLCLNLVETSVASGHKMLLFSQFTSMLDIIKQKLRERKIPFYVIEGSTKKEDRLSQVKSFNEDDTPVFLISLKAGGTGLNLTGADIVIHYDPWWNLSAQNQATDRAHRIGQNKNVSVYKLIAKNTIEEKIMALAQKKQSLAEQILPDEENILKGLTKEQILDLFRS